MAIFLDALPPDENGRTSGGAAAEKSSRAAADDTSGGGSELQMEMNCVIQGVAKFRNLCGKAVNQSIVSTVIIVLIVINAIMMGIGTFDFVTDDPKIEEAFEFADKAFLVTFTVEAGLQLIYRGFSMFKDGWLVFDFIIVVLSWSLDFLQIIRAFRVFRALRIITRIEIMRNLVAALFDIMPRLAAITALLLLIFYIFAVLCTQLFGELDLGGDYFTRLDHTLFTLFVMMTMEWADVARACMAQKWWAWVPFVAFIIITGFIVFNLIIAVVCDAVAAVESKESDLSSELMDSNMEASVAESMKMEDKAEDLSKHLDSIVDTQREMQMTLEILSEELYQSELAILKEEKEARASVVSRIMPVS